MTVNVYEICNALSMIPGGFLSLKLSKSLYLKAKETHNLKHFEHSTAVSSYTIVCAISILYHLSSAIFGKERARALMHLDYYAQQISGLLHIIAWNSHKNTANHVYIYILMMIYGRILTNERNLFLCQCLMAVLTLKKYIINPWWIISIITRLASYKYDNQSIYHSLFHLSITCAFNVIWNNWYSKN